MKTAADILDDIIRREGSRFTDHPADRGGPTKYGITLATLREWRRRANPSAITTIEDVKTLTEVEARTIYAQMYYIDPGFVDLTDLRLQALLVDCGVNHGTKRAVMWLQEAIGVKVDGDLGPMTRIAANASSRAGGLMRDTYAAIVARRVVFYGEIIANDPALTTAKKAGHRLQAENAEGWARRAAEFVREIGML